MSNADFKNPSLSRRQFLSGAGALGAAAIIAGAGSAIPSKAFATEEPSIEAKYESRTLSAGQQVEGKTVEGWFNINNPGGYHLDYLIVSDTAGSVVAQVVKHTGVLTALSAGKATLTCYLTPGEPKQQMPNQTCSPTGLFASITIYVEGSSDYGYQGNTNAIMMTNPSPISTTGNFARGYINQLGKLSAQDGYYVFTLMMTNGFRDYNTPEKFAKRNAGFVQALDAYSQDIATLNAENTGDIQVAYVDHNTRTIKFRIAASAIGTSGGIRFLKDFKGNNDNNSLGTRVTFQFSA